MTMFLGRFLLPLQNSIKLFRSNVYILALGFLVPLDPNLIVIAVGEQQIRINSFDFGIFIVDTDENMGQSDFIVLGA